MRSLSTWISLSLPASSLARAASRSASSGHLILNFAFDALHAHLQFALVALDGARARILVDVGDDELGEVEHPLQVARADVEQQPQPAGHALDVPDVADGRGQFDMAHALAAHALGATSTPHLSQTMPL
jgi:hypothetical protein